MLKRKALVFLSTFVVVALWSAVAFAADASGADNIFTTFSWIGNKRLLDKKVGIGRDTIHSNVIVRSCWDGNDDRVSVVD